MNHLTHFAPAGVLSALAAVLAVALIASEPPKTPDIIFTVAAQAETCGYIALPVSPLDTLAAAHGDPLALAKIATFNPAYADALGPMLEADAITDADAEEAADQYQSSFEYVETGHATFEGANGNN